MTNASNSLPALNNVAKLLSLLIPITALILIVIMVAGAYGEMTAQGFGVAAENRGNPMLASSYSHTDVSLAKWSPD